LPLASTWTGTVAGSVSRIYDNDFRISNQSVNGGNTVGFTYDNDGLLTAAGSLSLTRNSQNGLLTGTSIGTVTDSWGYNGFAEPTSYSAVANGSTVYDVTFTRDLLGRITQKVETIQGVSDTYDYIYDMAGRLDQVKKNSTVVSDYTYDGNSNRTQSVIQSVTTDLTYDAQDRLLTATGSTYTYTANGELSTKEDSNGLTTYHYDVMGNLREVNLPDGTTVQYVIDGQNRRVGKKVNGTLTQAWLYEGQLNPVAELDGNGNVVSRFIYGDRANVPSYMVKAGVTYRIIADHLGSPRLIVNTSNGAVAQRMDFDEFGNVLSDTNVGFQPFGFAGGLYDADTKLVRFGARDYDAEVGRWTAKDPILFRGGDTNLYGYVLNDPINFIDPNGKGPGPCPQNQQQPQQQQQNNPVPNPTPPANPNQTQQFLNNLSKASNVAAGYSFIAGAPGPTLLFLGISAAADTTNIVLFSNDPAFDTIRQALGLVMPIPQPYDTFIIPILEELSD
jgi:RHS repeat-associated protein